jgi:hypothetical protein
MAKIENCAADNVLTPASNSTTGLPQISTVTNAASGIAGAESGSRVLIDYPEFVSGQIDFNESEKVRCENHEWNEPHFLWFPECPFIGFQQHWDHRQRAQY